MTEKNFIDLIMQFAEVFAFIGGIGFAVFVAGRHVGRIVHKMDVIQEIMKNGFIENHKDHISINDKLDEHGQRITAVETRVEELCDIKK
jgi:hypothetical protein